MPPFLCAVWGQCWGRGGVGSDDTALMPTDEIHLNKLDHLFLALGMIWFPHSELIHIHTWKNAMFSTF